MAAPREQPGRGGGETPPTPASKRNDEAERRKRPARRFSMLDRLRRHPVREQRASR